MSDSFGARADENLLSHGGAGVTLAHGALVPIFWVWYPYFLRIT
jgi:hypothetical protein